MHVAPVLSSGLFQTSGQALQRNADAAEAAAEMAFEQIYEEALAIGDEPDANADTCCGSEDDLIESCGTAFANARAGMSGADSTKRSFFSYMDRYMTAHGTRGGALGPVEANRSGPTATPDSSVLAGALRDDNGTPAPQGVGGIDKNRLVEWMDSHALVHSSHRCAGFFRRAAQAAGADTSDRPVSGDAADYGGFLLDHGARVVPLESYQPQVGDTAVFARTADHPAGHIEIFDGERWVSDFVQRGFSPYRNPDDMPQFLIYRLS